jgi:hypothetical protein
MGRSSKVAPAPLSKEEIAQLKSINIELEPKKIELAQQQQQQQQQPSTSLLGKKLSRVMPARKQPPRNPLAVAYGRNKSRKMRRSRKIRRSRRMRRSRKIRRSRKRMV